MALSTIARAMSRSASRSTYTWQLPTPVSITGTVDSSTTERIRPAPPRGISTSTSPRARISSLADSWPSPGTSCTTSAGRPAPAAAVAQHGDDRRVGAAGAGGAAQQHGVAALEADAGGVGGDVGAGLVDDPDHAERHPHLAQLEAVGERRAADHLAHRVGQRGHVAQPVGHRGDPAGVEAQPVDERLGGAGLAGGLHVRGVGGEHVVGGRDQGVGHRVQRGVLGRPGGQRQLVGGLTGPDGDGLEGHRPRVVRTAAESRRGGRRSRGTPCRGTGRPVRSRTSRPTTSQRGRPADSRCSFHTRSASEEASRRLSASSQYWISARPPAYFRECRNGRWSLSRAQRVADDQGLDVVARDRHGHVPEPTQLAQLRHPSQGPEIPDHHRSRPLRRPRGAPVGTRPVCRAAGRDVRGLPKMTPCSESGVDRSGQPRGSSTRSSRCTTSRS